MATTPFEVRAPTGLTLTCDVFLQGNDTAKESAISLTEATNRKGIYDGSTTSDAAGWCTLHVKQSGTVIAVYDILLADDTSTYYAESARIGAAGVGLTDVSLSAAGNNAAADALLKRDWTGMTGEAARSVLNALRFLRNKWSISGTTVTVTKEDDTSAAWTSQVTTDAAAEPIISNDPT